MGVERARKREIMCYPTSATSAAGNKSTPRKAKINLQRNRLPISPASTSVSAAATAANTSSSSSSSLSFSSTTRTSNTAATAISDAAPVSPSRTPHSTADRVNNSSSSPPRREKNHSPILKVLFSALFVNPCAPSASASASASQVSNPKKKHRHIRRESRDDYLEGQNENQNHDSSSSSSPSSVILPPPRVFIYQKEEGGSTDEEEEELCQQQQEEEHQRIRRQIQMQQTLPLPSLDHQQGQQQRERARCLLSATTAAAVTAAPSTIFVAAAAVAVPVTSTSTSTSTKKVPVTVPMQMQHPFFLLEVDEHKVEEELWQQHQERQRRMQRQQQQSLPLPPLDHQATTITTTTITTTATTSITGSLTVAPLLSDTARATSTSSSTLTKKMQQQQQQQQLVAVEAKQQQQQLHKVQEQPFFLLDHLIDDLIPDQDQDQQGSYRESLAELFLNQENGYTSFNTAKKSVSTSSKYTPNKSSRSMMRRTQSCTVGGCTSNTSHSSSSPTSPSSSGCLFWSSMPWSSNTNNNNTNTNPNYNNTNVRSNRKVTKDNSKLSSSSSSLSLSLPATPKASNRKACRRRQIATAYEYEYDCARKSNLLVPPLRQHQDQASSKLNDTETTNNRTRTSSDITASTTCSSSDSLSTLGAPSMTAGEEDVASSCSSRTITRNSSISCPQFVDKNAATPTTKLSKRRQEQLDRRERRSKFTVVQRSLTLAQGWNSKGLFLASKATQAEAEQQAEALLKEEEEGRTEMDHPHHEEEQEQQEKVNIFGLWSHALHCWNDSLQIYLSLLGNIHERVADVQNNRGLALGKLNQYKYAQQAFQQALTIHQQRLVRVQKIKRTHRDTEKQRLLRKIQQHGNNKNSSWNSKASASSSEEASIMCAIVSTFHNTSNMYHEAGEPLEAIRVLSEGQLLLETSIIGPLEQQTIMMDHETDTENNRITTTTTTITFQHYFQYYQLLARLYTAIGHIYYSIASDSNGNGGDNDNGDDEDDIESESLQESKIYYQNALHVYENLFLKCTTTTTASSSSRRSATQDSNPNEDEVVEHQYQQQQQYQHQQHRDLIQQEIQLLQQDIHELNRCCQEGSRRRRGRGQGGKERQRQQQQQKKQTSSSFFTFIDSMTNT